MKASNGWVRIELWELAAPVALGVAVLIALSSSVDATEAWVLVGDSLAERLTFPWWIAAGLLGFSHLGWEDLTSTRDYQRHRGLAFERLFRLRVASGLAGVGALVVVPVLVHALAFHLFAADGELLFWERLGSTLVYGSLAPATFAAAGWGVNTNGSWVQRGSHAILASCSVLVVARRLAEPAPDAWAASPALFVAVMGALTVAFLFAARGSFVRSTDLDRPLDVGQACVDGACLVFAYTMAFGSLVAAGQDRFLLKAFGDGPQIVALPAATEDGPGELVLARSDDEVGLARCDAAGGWLTPDGAPSDEPRPLGTARRLFHPWMHVVALRRPAWGFDDRGRFDPSDVQFDAPWEELWSDARTHAFLVRDAVPRGAVFVLESSGDTTPRPARRWRLERPDGGPLDRSVTVVGHEDDGPEEVLIGDPRDGTLWRVVETGDAPRLEAVELPGGARFRAWNGHDPVQIATDGPTFAWDGDGFRPSDTPFVAGTAYDRARYEAGLELETVEHGADGLTARFVDAHSGTTVFEHRFDPAAATGHRFAVVLGTRALSWLRPPAVVLASHVAAPPLQAYERLTFLRAYLREPLVAGGRHLGWVAFVLASFGALAWLSVRALRRRGAGLGRAAFWFAAVLLGGVGGLLALGSIELARQWRSLPATRPAAPPRLVSRPAGT